eukprot:1952370-Rhodomonas_salina.1
MIQVHDLKAIKKGVVDVRAAMNALRSFGTLRLQLFLRRTGGLYALARVAQEKQLFVEHLRACPRCPIAQ